MHQRRNQNPTLTIFNHNLNFEGINFSKKLQGIYY